MTNINSLCLYFISFVPLWLAILFIDIKNIVEQDIILINDDTAINMARKLSKELGLGVGISSGANFIGAVLLQEKLEKNVVTIFADDNKKYLSTELKNEKIENADFLSDKIKLLDYEEVY